ncbi:signal peptidase II [bacterium]|nr:signal peptidase II [bacterium]
MARTATLFSLLVFSILTALATRGILSLSDLNGQTVLPLGLASLNLEYTINTGINFGLAGEASNSQQLRLATLALLVCLTIIVWGMRSAVRWAPLIAGLFAGGGLANALERFFYGGVFDYINVSFIFYKNPFSFNIADIYIFIGALLFVFKPSGENL